MKGSLRIGRVAGVPVGMHWSLLAIGGLIAWGLAEGTLRADYPGLASWTYYAVATAGAVLFFASVLAHEVAHAIAARRFGIDVEGIDLWLLGGMARLSREAPSPLSEGVIAVAGPLGSLTCAAVFGGVALGLEAAGLHGPAISMFGWLAVANAILTGFNLLPAAPLDGGRILQAVVWRIRGNRLRAGVVAARAGRVVGFGLIAYGVWSVGQGSNGLFTAIVGWFIVSNAKVEELGFATRAAIEGKRVRDLAWFGVARAEDWTDVATMLSDRGRMGPPQVVAVQSLGGRVVGFVTGGMLDAVPLEQRWSVRLGQLAVPSSMVTRATPDDAVGEVLARTASPIPVIAVWDGDDLVGVLTPGEVERARH